MMRSCFEALSLSNIWSLSARRLLRRSSKPRSTFKTSPLPVPCYPIFTHLKYWPPRWWRCCKRLCWKPTLMRALLNQVQFYHRFRNSPELTVLVDIWYKLAREELMWNPEGEKCVHCQLGGGAQARRGEDAAGGGRGSGQGGGETPSWSILSSSSSSSWAWSSYVRSPWQGTCQTPSSSISY